MCKQPNDDVNLRSNPVTKRHQIKTEKSSKRKEIFTMDLEGFSMELESIIDFFFSFSKKMKIFQFFGFSPKVFFSFVCEFLKKEKRESSISGHR